VVRRSGPRPNVGRGGGSTPRPGPRSTAPTPSPHARFLRQGRDRAEREWARYEGTAQRDLFRLLRERFLARHAVSSGWTLDVGAGPGRFAPLVGRGGARPIALDLSLEMLRRTERARGSGTRTPEVERVRGDALRLPFPDGTFSEVALLGNTLGFEADAGERLLDSVESRLAPGGCLLVEAAPGPGERSRYLARLPPSAVRRLLAAPPPLVASRLRSEGYSVEPVRHRTEAFRRWSAPQLIGRWEGQGWTVDEVTAVAPALGADPERLSEAAKDPRAWARLLELEELIGRQPARWAKAAAVLLAARAPP